MGPSSSKRARGRRGASISWKGSREAYGAISTASSSIATIRSPRRTSSATRSPSRLVAHGARRVRPRALALARHVRGDEVQRVQLRVGVRQRRPRLAALVDDQLHVRAPRVRAHPLAPHPHRRDHLLDGELRQRVHRLGRVHDHLVRAPRGHRREQIGAASGRVATVPGLAGRVERGKEVGHHPDCPAGSVGPHPPSGPQRVQLRRRAVLVALGERVLLGVDRVRRERSAARRLGAGSALRPRSSGARSAGPRGSPGMFLGGMRGSGGRARSVLDVVFELRRAAGRGPGGCTCRRGGCRRR